MSGDDERVTVNKKAVVCGGKVGGVETCAGGDRNM